MKKSLLSILLLFVTVISFGQCPTSNVILTTQAEVNNFGIDFGTCVQTTFDITISGADITDLSPLENLQIIDGTLSIVNNPLLTSLAYPANDFTANEVIIANNPQLTSFTGFPLYEVNTMLVENNSALQDVVLNVFPLGASSMIIRNNSSLSTIGPLVADGGFATFYVESNPQLSAFNFDPTGDFSTKNFRLVNNDNLITTDGMFFAQMNTGSIGEGSFVVEDNDLLQTLSNPSFDGGGSINEIQNVIIKDNPSLNSMDALFWLNNATTLTIDNNDSLLSLQELAASLVNVENYNVINNGQLTSIEYCEFVTATNINIENNPNLASIIDACDRLENTLTLNINNNGSLEDISGLKSIVPDNLNTVTITDNGSLSVCSITSICGYLDIGTGTTTILNNTGLCETQSDVELGCGIIGVPGLNFLNTLVDHSPVIDVNDDGDIQVAEARAFTGTILAANKNIEDFTGIEEFINVTGIEFQENQMTTLDLSENTALTSVRFQDNPLLETVNLRNGTNMLITTFEGNNSPDLLAICVDDIAFAEANFTTIDPQVQFVEDCNLLGFSTEILNPEAIMLVPNPVQERLSIIFSDNLSLKNATIYSVLGQVMMESNVTSIDFSKLKSGVYFITIETTQGSITKKIVKE